MGQATSRRSRVFVLELSSQAEPQTGHLVGRLEHVDSGCSVQFASTEEMNEFLARMLCEVAEPGLKDTGRHN